MVLKPSEVAPLNAILFAEIMDEAGVPAGVFNLVNGDGVNVGAVLSSHPDIDMVSFTGSTRAGIEVARAAAPTVKRVAQELGGKSANIILDDADLEAAISRDMAGMCTNSGQSCNAPTRMLVPARTHGRGRRDRGSSRVERGGRRPPRAHQQHRPRGVGDAVQPHPAAHREGHRRRGEARGRVARVGPTASTPATTCGPPCSPTSRTT